MPRLVAHQWQTWRGPQTAIRTLCRPQRVVRPTLAATVRAYATQTSSGSKAFPTVRPLNSAIIIPSSVKDISPDGLVNYINPVSLENVTKDTFCVFLATPSFAPWLLNDDVFLNKAIRQVYSNAFTGASGRLTIQALCAVVDKLPAGRAITPGATLDSEVIRRSSEPPVGDIGYEGIAFITLPATASVPTTSPRSPEKGAIDFMLSGETANKSTFHDTWRLPLANTVFQTGTPTTMHLSQWNLLGERGSLDLEKKTDISHHGIGLTAADETAGQPLSALSIPLLPLTLPRQVEGCMGNIIRRVVGPNKESVTASSELEKVVPQFFKSRGEPPQPTTAWALVIPGSMKHALKTRTLNHLSRRMGRKEKRSDLGDALWERLWRSDPTSWNKLVPEALAEGARLHRVLSGGGGWGKKAGLLSLDPVPMSEEVPIRMEDATSGFDGPGDFSTALTPVVQDGDAIQFFISPSPMKTANTVEHDELAKLKQTSKDQAWGWELGTIPSTVDSIPGGSWQHVGSDSKFVAVFRHSFGALAEGGMTLTRRLYVAPGQPLSTLATTTIDVPYSRFWTVELEDKQGSTKDSINSWLYESKKNISIRAMKQSMQAPRQVVLPRSTPDLDHPRIPPHKVSTKAFLSSEAAGGRLDQATTTIAQLIEEHTAIMRTLNNRQRRVKDRKTRRDEMKFSAQRRLVINTPEGVVERVPLLSTLQASGKQVAVPFTRMVPDPHPGDAKDSRRVTIHRPRGQPRTRRPIDLERTGQSTWEIEKEIVDLPEQSNKVKHRQAQGASVRTFISKKSTSRKIIARSFSKEEGWLRHIDKTIAHLDAQYKILALRVRRRRPLARRTHPKARPVRAERLRITKHVTIRPHRRQHGVRGQDEFRKLAGPMTRSVLTSRQRRVPRPRDTDAKSERKSGREDFIGTVGSWLGG